MGRPFEDYDPRDPYSILFSKKQQLEEENRRLKARIAELEAELKSLRDHHQYGGIENEE